MRNRIFAALGLAAAAVTLTTTVANAATVTTTTDVKADSTVVNGVFNLPDVNSQFTSETITVTGKTIFGCGVGCDGTNYWTSYDANGMDAGFAWSTGLSDGRTDGLIAEKHQVGALLYRVDGGEWTPIDGNTNTVTIDHLSKTASHTVQVAFNERPTAESYADNAGSLNVHVVRTKA
jgi:hypothetical protein